MYLIVRCYPSGAVDELVSRRKFRTIGRAMSSMGKLVAPPSGYFYDLRPVSA